jgi:hypothetical protein
MHWLKNTAIGFKKRFSEQEELGICGHLCSKSKRLLLSIDIDEQQKAFILAKEIAYNYLEITERLYT